MKLLQKVLLRSVISKIVKLFWQISCSVWVTSTNTYLLHLSRFTEAGSCDNISLCMWESKSRELGWFQNRGSCLMVTTRLRSQELRILFLMLLNFMDWGKSSASVCRIWLLTLSIDVYVYHSLFITAAFITITKLQTKMKLSSQYTAKHLPNPVTFLLCKEQKTHLDRFCP